MVCRRGGIDDTLKVMDFGLARALDPDKTDQEQHFAGTPLYVAPEIILRADGAGPQSDIYALAVTAWFMLMGHPPFEGPELVEVLSDHLATEPPPLACPDPALRALIERSLAKDPLTRPADAREFLNALRDCESAKGWTSEHASVWWAEHREVVDAYTATQQASLTERSRSGLRGSRSRSRATG